MQLNLALMMLTSSSLLTPVYLCNHISTIQTFYLLNWCVVYNQPLSHVISTNWNMTSLLPRICSSVNRSYKITESHLRKLLFRNDYVAIENVYAVNKNLSVKQLTNNQFFLKLSKFNDWKWLKMIMSDSEWLQKWKQLPTKFAWLLVVS